MQQIAIKIIYDNKKENPAMQEGWGFSCLIDLSDKKILFDTGANKAAFFSNLEQLAIQPETITDVVFSHQHDDHITGLEDVLNWRCCHESPDLIFLFLIDFKLHHKSY